MIKIQEKEHILEVLKETITAIENEDIIKLKDLSNQTVHTASINQDADNIIVAVLIYSIGKIIERQNYKNYPQYKSFLQSIKYHISNLISFLENQELNKFRYETRKIRQIIAKLSGNFKTNIQNIFRKAEINKASRIYEHGISMEKTAKLLGVSLWELAEYAGQTGISNVSLNKTMSVKTRIKIAMDIFKK